MPKTKACSYADRDAIIARKVCLACARAGKFETISVRAGVHEVEGELRFCGSFWGCDSKQSWEHFMLSVGGQVSGPRITASITLPSERVETPYDRSKAVLRRQRVNAP